MLYIKVSLYFLHSYGVKLLDYKDMLRTSVVPEPDGQNAMCLRHLAKMGYNLIVVSSGGFFFPKLLLVSD